MVCEQEFLLKWYRSHRRELPWRQTSDPYAIWISEIMLQQTTVETVLGYFEPFIKVFPTVEILAESPLPLLLSRWAGLGYYQRARNLHRAAKEIARSGFPTQYQQLIRLPGFGEYTSRSVASLAFNQSVGVLDGNVIRVLTRRFGSNTLWWTTPGRRSLQKIVDDYVVGTPARETNQALMELGALLCRQEKPLCSLCPLIEFCKAYRSGEVLNYPIKRARRTSELWLWEVALMRRGQKLGLIENSDTPFLKKAWVFPGRFVRVAKMPPVWDFQHRITHHQIFVRVLNSKPWHQASRKQGVRWVRSENLAQVSPYSILQKVLKT